MRERAKWLAIASVLYSPIAGATTYYVSPTGSDSNSGVSPNAPWGSVAKIDATVFQPGDQILFQYGSTWDANLNATANGTAALPIVYGAYGTPSLGNPTFVGSDPISASAFTPVSGTTYVATSATPVNWVYNFNQFTQEAQDNLALQGSTQSGNPATDLSYVESNPGSFYYNSGNGQLFVNPGASIANQSLRIGTRTDAIYSVGHSNLVFQNLNTSETAQDGGGYGVRIENSQNVTLLNSTVSLSGKHGVGVIDTVGFTGTNVVANGSAPSQGFGGASAFVTYGDANADVPTGTNNTSVWTNVSYINPEGAYPVFISHGSPNGVAAITINNVTSQNGYGTGLQIFSTGSNETALINGGTLSGNASEIDTNNSVINGLTVNGNGSNASVYITGTGTVVQNSVFNGITSNLNSEQYGAIVDEGTNNTVRFNVATQIESGPGVGIIDPKANVFGNIVLYAPPSSPGITTIGLIGSLGTQLSNYNVFLPSSQFLNYPNVSVSAQQWQSLGYDLNSIFAAPVFTNSDSDDYSLVSGSPGTGLDPLPLDPSLSVANSFIGPRQSNGNYNAGLNPYMPTNLSSLSTQYVLNISLTNVLTPFGGTLVLQSTAEIVVLNGTLLDMVGNVVNNGSFLAIGGLFETGNFINSGTAIFSGAQIWSPGTTLTNVQGITTFETDAGGAIAPAEYLSVNVSGGLVVFASTQHLMSLTIAAGAKAQLPASGASDRLILFTPSIVSVGTLDLTNNDLIVQQGSLAAVTALIESGFNGGKWTGSGITSTSAEFDTTHLTALGVILNTVDGITPLYGTGDVLGPFDGASPSPNDILVRLAYYGDTNLDGVVDGTDYSRVDNGYLRHLTGWLNGDFNYDGVVNGSDYTLIDNAYNGQGASITASLAALSAGPVSVPEPGSPAFAAVGALLLRRRKVAESLV